MELDELLDQLLTGVDTDSELTRRRAFQALVEYADLNLELPEYMLFVTEAARRLGQEKLLAEMLQPRLRTNGTEKVHIRYDDEEGCQIIANPEGCLYLTRAFRALALAPSPGAHLHLDYDMPPLVGETYPAVLYVEDDDYFEREVENASGRDLWEVRDVDPAEVVGFFLAEAYPDYLPCVRNRIYPVTGYAWYKDQRLAYRKDVRDDTSRLVVFTFTLENGQSAEVALDLDDDEVIFITRREAARLNGEGTRGE